MDEIDKRNALLNNEKNLKERLRPNKKILNAVMNADKNLGYPPIGKPTEWNPYTFKNYDPPGTKDPYEEAMNDNSWKKKAKKAHD